MVEQMHARNFRGKQKIAGMKGKYETRQGR